MKLPSPEDIRARLLQRWRKGEFFSSELGCPDQSNPTFPLRVSVRTPTAREMSESFAAVQDWAQKYLQIARDAKSTVQHDGPSSATTIPTVEWKEHQHRQLGANKLPQALVLNTVEELARFVKGGAVAELAHFREAAELLQDRLPELLPWACARPLELLSVPKTDLERLTDAALWIREHPQPGIYLRQLPVPKVDTKFVEGYRGVLSRWLDLLLPNEAVDRNWSGVRNFERRYGFAYRPELVRVRILDDVIRLSGFSDITVPGAEFSHWAPASVRRVLVLENDVTALSLPPLPATVAIFGRGYHFEHLSGADWLHGVELYYWGDIDTHGFAILEQFRQIFPHTQSFLMDRDTLDAHELQWGKESAPTRNDLPLLTPEEQSLYDDLRLNRISPQLRLEQELIGFSVIEAALSKLS
ncbi:MAG: hypothetical protein EA428_09285 [Spirochaetaceae bacterium]|nr:MAG: hypothetical protein EA428_09285 [Spirochaetaceae bacterium]